MAEAWFSLSRSAQLEALEYASGQLARPPHLLEKDVWVVWALAQRHARQQTPDV